MNENKYIFYQQATGQDAGTTVITLIPENTIATNKLSPGNTINYKLEIQLPEITTGKYYFSNYQLSEYYK